MEEEDFPMEEELMDIIRLKRTNDGIDLDDDSNEDTPLEELLDIALPELTLHSVHFRTGRWPRQRALAYLTRKNLTPINIFAMDFVTIYEFIILPRQIPVVLISARDAIGVWFGFVLTEDLEEDE